MNGNSSKNKKRNFLCIMMMSNIMFLNEIKIKLICYSLKCVLFLFSMSIVLFFEMQLKSNVEFSLSIDAIKDIPFDRYGKDFTFIVNGQQHQTCRIIADILSPRIREYHLIDETINMFHINIDDLKVNYFSEILSLISFEKQQIKEEQLKYFIKIFYILDNKKEFQKLIPKYENEITINNVFERIQNKQDYFDVFQINPQKEDDEHYNYHSEINKSDFGISTKHEMLKDEIEFISCHFYEIDHEKIKKLDKFIIEEIIKNKTLKLEDEDSLLKFIIEMYSKSHEYSFLFEYVNFLNVSQKEIQHFYEIFDLNDINQQIWRSIISQTINSKKNEKAINKRYNQKTEGISLIYKEGQEFNGIIKYLTDKTGGNIHDNGTIEITSNSYYAGDHPSNLLDFNVKTQYESPRKEAWICFDFKKMKVKITNYSIKSSEGGQSSCHLKSWDLEVSNDGDNWIKIDHHSNCSTLNGDGFVGTFDAQQNEFAQFVRLRQTDDPWGGDYLKICYIEFYGFLKNQ